jgi:hypothetical protein
MFVIVKNWIKNRELAYRFDDSQFLEEIGNSGNRKVIEFVKAWLDEERDCDSFLKIFPNILFSLFKKQKDYLIALFRILDKRFKKNILLITCMS